MVPTGLESAYLWSGYSSLLPHAGGFSICKENPKDLAKDILYSHRGETKGP